MKIVKKLMILLTLIIATFSVANAKNKSNLTVLNTGSKTGGFSQQSLAYYMDLAKMKGDFNTIQLVNPGNRCVAMNAILLKLEGPVLFPWGSDMEAEKRCDTSFNVASAKIVRFVEKFQYLCQVDPKLDVTKNSGRIGHRLPLNGSYSKTVKAVNNSFGTKHKNIAYDGWGNAKIALLNGEIDYAIVSPPGNAQIEAEGGTCRKLSRDKASLFALDGKNKDLVSSNIDVWIALNMTAEQANDLSKKLKKIHYECDTAISKWQKGCDSKGTALLFSEFDIDKTHLIRWNDSVRWNTIVE